jgi:hypothetical protein
MIASLGRMPAGAFYADLRSQSRKYQLFDPTVSKLRIEICPHESIKRAMSAGDNVAAAGVKRFVKIRTKFALPENVVFHRSLHA